MSDKITAIAMLHLLGWLVTRRLQIPSYFCLAARCSSAHAPCSHVPWVFIGLPILAQAHTNLEFCYMKT